MLLAIGSAGAVLALAGAAGFEALYRSRDAATIRLEATARDPWQELPATSGRRVFRCRVPFHNQNRRYEQTLVDVAARVRLLLKDGLTPQDAQAVVSVHLEGGEGRSDGYWAANLIGADERCHASIEVTIAGAPEVLGRLHAAVVQLGYQTYGRRELLRFDDEIVLPLSPVKPLPAPIQGETVSIQCVPTPVLTDIDDIVEVIDRHTRSFRQPGDVVAVAESVVAITQRQYFRPSEVKPGFWAKRLCYFIPSKGSLSSPYGFQLAMDQVGPVRMVASLFIGALGKAVGQNGWFYSLAGRPAELIDDITGTMPPFDKYIVAGPREPQALVDRIKQATGMEAAIVDANDLKRAMVLACTAGVASAEVSRMLLDNPFGNAAEQTPLVVLRPLGAGEEGRSQRDQACSV